MNRYLWAMIGIVLVMATSAHAERINFTGLNSADVSDGDGQTFAWTAAGRSGAVVARANWPNVTAVNGALNTDTQGGASLGNPFVGTLSLIFSEPVEVILRATFPSLLRDGLNGGRFEQVQLAAPGVAFASLPGTSAIYTGAGTNTILADDQFSQNPTVSNWGFVGSGLASNYQFQYTSTSFGLSETFDVIVVPEPASAALGGLALVAIAGWRRKACASASSGARYA
jgi:hypothetical protein